MNPTTKRIVLGLAGVLAADGAFNTVGLYPVAASTRWGRWAKEWTKDDLDNLRFPQRLRFLFPIIKGGSVAGLTLGMKWRGLGRVTSAALVAYFILAVGFHARAKDAFFKSVPATALLAWSGLAWRALDPRRA